MSPWNDTGSVTGTSQPTFAELASVKSFVTAFWWTCYKIHCCRHVWWSGDFHSVLVWSGWLWEWRRNRPSWPMAAALYHVSLLKWVHSSANYLTLVVSAFVVGKLVDEWAPMRIHTMFPLSKQWSCEWQFFRTAVFRFLVVVVGVVVERTD